MTKLSNKRTFPKCPKCDKPGRCYWHQERIHDVVNDVWGFGCQCGHCEIIKIQVYPLGKVSKDEKLIRSCPFCHQLNSRRKPHAHTNRDMSCPDCGSINYYTCTKGEEWLYNHNCKKCGLNFATPDPLLSPRDENGRKEQCCPACNGDLLAYADVPPR